MRFVYYLLLAAGACAAGSAGAGLVGSQVSLRTIAQATRSSVPVVTSFERSVTVSANEVEYPDVASLFNPGSPVPPGFARSLVNVAIDVADWYITIDFRNAESWRYANGFQNTYAFRFVGAADLTNLAPQIDAGATTLGLDPADVAIAGNELLINVEGLPFDPTTFVRINLIEIASGIPTAMFSGPSENYLVEKRGVIWRVTDLVGVDGATTLAATQRLRFADKSFDLVNAPRTTPPAYGQARDFLFDAVFYLLDNPELVPALSRATAAQHYLTTGAAEGRWPNAWFDATYYKNRWPDLTPLNLDNATLFLHYNLYGVWEGRSAGPVFDRFDGNRYLRDNPDVAAYVDAYLADFLGSRTNGAIAHYVIYGQHELRPAFNVSGQPIQLGYVANLGQ